MRCQCIICTDHFDGATQIANVPCGHTFHQACLERWLKNSPTCPTCRVRVRPSDVRKVFLQSLNDTVLDSGSVENELSEATLRIHELRQRINHLEEEQKSFRNIISKSETALEATKRKYHEAIKEKDALKAKSKFMKASLEENQMLKSTINQLQSTIEKTHHLRTVLSGTTTEVEEMLKTFGPGENSVREIATHCVLIKRELSRKNREIRICQDQSTGAQRKIQQMNQELKERGQQLEKAIADASKYKEQCSQLTNRLENLPERQTAGVKRTSSDSASPKLDVTVVPSPPVLKVRSGYLSKNPKHNFQPLPGYSKMKIVQMKKPELPKSAVNEDEFLFSLMKKKASVDSDNKESKIRTGYNGLGGHSSHIQRSK